MPQLWLTFPESLRCKVEQDDVLTSAMTDLIVQVLSKPAAYVQIIIQFVPRLVMDRSDAPACSARLMSIGGINTENNKKYCSGFWNAR